MSYKEYTVKVYAIYTTWNKVGTDIFHREGGPAIEYPAGDKYWYIDGKIHREDGPAVKLPNGYKAWYIRGKRHRENGPAIEYFDGDKHWYLEGVEYTEEEFNKKMSKPSCDGKIIEVDGKKYQLKFVE